MKPLLALFALALIGCSSTQTTHEPVEDTAAIEELIYDGEDVVLGQAPAPEILVKYDALAGEKIVSEKTTILKEASFSTPSRFTTGMNQLRRDCNMRLKPSAQASPDGILRKGKKVWADSENDHWAKVYRKSGRVSYVYKGCF